MHLRNQWIWKTVGILINSKWNNTHYQIAANHLQPWITTFQKKDTSILASSSNSSQQGTTIPELVGPGRFTGTFKATYISRSDWSSSAPIQVCWWPGKCTCRSLRRTRSARRALRSRSRTWSCTCDRWTVVCRYGTTRPSWSSQGKVLCGTHSVRFAPRPDWSARSVGQWTGASLSRWSPLLRGAGTCWCPPVSGSSTARSRAATPIAALLSLCRGRVVFCQCAGSVYVFVLWMAIQVIWIEIMASIRSPWFEGMKWCFRCHFIHVEHWKEVWRVARW